MLPPAAMPEFSSSAADPMAPAHSTTSSRARMTRSPIATPTARPCSTTTRVAVLCVRMRGRCTRGSRSRNSRPDELRNPRRWLTWLRATPSWSEPFGSGLSRCPASTAAWMKASSISWSAVVLALFAAVVPCFADTVNDPNFVIDAEKQSLHIRLTGGEEMAGFLTDVYKTPPEVVNRVAGALGYLDADKQ